jgi:2-keto-3-deoxy-L-fuconate dehydrogenase
MLDFKNKSVVISGGGSGIGKAASLAFGKRGAHVHILEWNKEHASITQQEIKAASGAATTYECDVSNQETVAEIMKRIGVVDVLINSAGVSHIGKADNTSTQDFEKLFNVNVKGVYNCIHEAIPIMKRQGKGVILNICSVAAYTGIADRFAYSMSKGAVFAMTLSVAKDYLKDNIRCNCVSPARIHTPFVDDFLKKNYPGREQEMFEALAKTQPIGRMGTPEEVAQLVVYLCSDQAAFITGSDYPIDGGFLRLNT